MGMFGDAKVNMLEISEFFGPGADAYMALITRFEVCPTKNNPDKIGLNITYTFSEGRHMGWDEREWFEVPQGDCPLDPDGAGEWEKKWGKIKRRFLGLNVPESRMMDVTPEDMLNQEVIVTLKKKRNAKPDDANPHYIASVQLASSASKQSVATAKAASSNKGAANPFD